MLQQHHTPNDNTTRRVVFEHSISAIQLSVITTEKTLRARERMRFGIIALLACILVDDERHANGLSSTPVLRSTDWEKRNAVAWVEGASKSHDGRRRQLEDATMTFHEGQRCVVMGDNGCGKSTLLEVLASIERLDKGTVRVRKGLRVCHVEQEPYETEEWRSKTGREVLLAGDGPSVSAARELEAAEAALDASDDASLARYERALERATRDDAWAVEAAVSVVCARLGVEALLERRVGELSGGEKKRLALAAALLSGADMLLLDEPTNHLDVWAVRWLEKYLTKDEAASSRCVIFVTHDRSFAEATANSLVELDSGRAYEHRVSNSSGSLVEAYIEGKAKRLADDESASASARSKLRKELIWLRRGAKARQTKSTERIARLETLREAAQSSPQKQKGLALDLRDRAARTRGAPIAEFEDAGLSGLFQEFDFELGSTDRVGIVGQNGCGKSSLIEAVVARAKEQGQLCAGSEPERREFDSGTARLAATAKVGYYSQLFDPATRSGTAETPLDFAMDVLMRRSKGGGSDDASLLLGDRIAAAKSLLQSYAFDSDDLVNAPLSQLSGGERRRLQLMSVLDAKPNFLVMDEVSNDLDLNALQSLERFLVQDFKGALLLVSHDRALLDATCTKLLVLLGDGYVSEFAGSMSDYLAIMDQAAAEGGGDYHEDGDELEEDDDESALIDAKRQRQESNAERRRRLNAPKLIEKIASTISEREAEIAALDAEMAKVASDPAALEPLFADRGTLQSQVDEMYVEWEELESLLSS